MLDLGLLVAVSVPVVVFSGEHVAFSNELHNELIGRPGDAIVGRAAVELLGPQGAATLTKTRAGLATDRSEAILPLDWRSPGGDTVRVFYKTRAVSTSEATELVVMTAVPMPAPGLDDRRSVVTPNATERAALSSRCAAFEGIVSLANDAIIAVDADQRIVLFNEGAEKIFGWGGGEAIGRPLEILLAPRFRARHHVQVERFAHEQSNARRMAGARSDLVGLRKNGEEFPAEAGISRIQCEGTTLLAVVLRDIGERKRRESEQRFLAHAGAVLASSLDYQETLATVARLAVPLLADCCVVDLLQEDTIRRLKVVHVDPSKAQLVADLEAMELREPGAHPVWQALTDQRAVLLSTLPPGYLEQIAQDPEHLSLLRALAPVSLLSVPLVSRSRVLGALSFVSIRLDRLYGQSELHLAEELARRAALAIDNAQLYAVSQQAIRARDELLGVVAHDLRNPLCVVTMAAEGILRLHDDVPDRLRSPLDAISRAAAHANRLVQDLLDIARIEGGRSLHLERASCRPIDLLNDARAMMRPSAEAAHILLSVDSADDLPPIEVDRERILQVFSNLVGNAVKFTPDGGRVQLMARLIENDVRFAVRDSGAGISAEQLPHVFDRYWQAWSADRRGIGLGLAIVKGIVGAHGGRVWVESRPGEGSTFFFAIPRARVQLPTDG